MNLPSEKLWTVQELSSKFYFSGRSPTVKFTIYEVDWPKQTVGGVAYEAFKSFEPDESFDPTKLLELVGYYKDRWKEAKKLRKRRKLTSSIKGEKAEKKLKKEVKKVLQERIEIEPKMESFFMKSPLKEASDNEEENSDNEESFEEDKKKNGIQSQKARSFRGMKPAARRCTECIKPLKNPDQPIMMESLMKEASENKEKFEEENSDSEEDKEKNEIQSKKARTFRGYKGAARRCTECIKPLKDPDQPKMVKFNRNCRCEFCVKALDNSKGTSFLQMDCFHRICWERMCEFAEDPIEEVINCPVEDCKGSFRVAAVEEILGIIRSVVENENFKDEALQKELKKYFRI